MNYFEALGKKSFLYRLDARVKLVVLLLFAWKIALSSSFGEVLGFVPFVAALLFCLRGDVGRIFRILLAADAFLIFLVVSAFIYGNVSLGLLLFLKSNEILVISIALLMTSEPFQIFRAFRDFRLPAKLVQLFFLTYRYIYTIYDEYRLMLKSAYCRGFRPKTSLNTYKTYAYILANLLVKSYFRADRIYKAMLCRGFRGEFPVYGESKMKKEDYAFAVVSFLVFTVVELWSLSGQRTFL
ncbi:cobalt/nickel transport system permease protein [Desulfurobacterium pacificum]|uniref:Cobalt/nickel transport system permease protein n=1 Tax=Desulfurobacterium pacificum TaxID=240166 RepID=A0ABY1NKF1_9BACT|nr:energy-coupling factor transporter transmembrane component T [Desulfurobacterium pacificum]SMP11822.1 cobalt/nickel transport system permease protein [Desulfurobacterium pacificum]